MLVVTVTRKEFGGVPLKKEPVEDSGMKIGPGRAALLMFTALLARRLFAEAQEAICFVPFSDFGFLVASLPRDVLPRWAIHGKPFEAFLADKALPPRGGLEDALLSGREAPW